MLFHVFGERKKAAGSSPPFNLFFVKEDAKSRAIIICKTDDILKVLIIAFSIRVISFTRFLCILLAKFK